VVAGHADPRQLRKVTIAARHLSDQRVTDRRSARVAGCIVVAEMPDRPVMASSVSACDPPELDLAACRHASGVQETRDSRVAALWQLAVWARESAAQCVAIVWEPGPGGVNIMGFLPLMWGRPGGSCRGNLHHQRDSVVAEAAAAEGQRG
jgi:hypothetical protein